MIDLQWLISARSGGFRPISTISRWASWADYSLSGWFLVSGTLIRWLSVPLPFRESNMLVPGQRIDKA
ncbi:MAG: hypothetical protein WA261_11180 [Candidatus Sulfotelmatobacter sp.]